MRGVVRGLGMFLLALSAAAGVAQGSRSCKVDRTVPDGGQYALARGDYGKAEEIYDAALKVDPKSLAAQLGLVRAEVGEGKLTEAQMLVHSLTAAAPQDAQVLLAAGEVAIRRGEPGEAETAYDAAMKADPCSGRARYDIARYLQLTGMAATARGLLQSAHTLSPTDPVILAGWAEATGERQTVAQQVARLSAMADAADATKEQKAEAAVTLKRLQAEERGSCTAVVPTSTAKLKLVSLADAEHDRDRYGGYVAIRRDGTCRIYRLSDAK